MLLRLSRQKRAVINQNFLRGLALVVSGTVLGALRLITPIAAAVFHVTGSLLVVFNSFPSCATVKNWNRIKPLLWT